MQMQPALDDLKIDPEFESKIPQLTKEEFELLEKNIVEDGRVTDRLVVWNNTILDGHNRYRILKKHPEIPFEVVNMTFPDKYTAIAWICRKQLGRRNLTPEQRKYLLGKRYEAEKASHGGLRNKHRDVTGQFTTSSQNGNLWSNENTAEQIAEENNVGKNSVIRAEKYAKGVDAAEEVLPGIKQEILSGSIKPTQASVAAVGRADPKERFKLAKQLRQPKVKPEKPEPWEEIENTIPDDEEDLDEYKRSPEDNEEPAGTPVRADDELDMDDEDSDIDDSDEDTDDEIPPPIRIPKKSEIMALAKAMEHSEGQVLGTVEDMIYEMNNALEDMIWRWNFCREAYVKPIRSRDGKMQIKELAVKGIEYMKEVRKGMLWKDEPI